MSKQNQKEEHHVVPLSIGGPNWKENCVTLTQSEHKMTHDVLDIPYGMLRRFRKRTNHLLYMDTYFVEETKRLHMLYFARMPMLQSALIAKHLHCIKSVFHRACTEYHYIPKYDAIKDQDLSRQFFFYLGMYHHVLYHKAQELEKLLPPQNHPTWRNIFIVKYVLWTLPTNLLKRGKLTPTISRLTLYSFVRNAK